MILINTDMNIAAKTKLCIILACNQNLNLRNKFMQIFSNTRQKNVLSHINKWEIGI